MAPRPTTDHRITPKKIARWLRVSEAAVRKMIQRGTIPKPRSADNGERYWDSHQIEDLFDWAASLPERRRPWLPPHLLGVNECETEWVVHPMCNISVNRWEGLWFKKRSAWFVLPASGMQWELMMDMADNPTYMVNHPCQYLIVDDSPRPRVVAIAPEDAHWPFGCHGFELDALARAFGPIPWAPEELRDLEAILAAPSRPVEVFPAGDWGSATSRARKELRMALPGLSDPSRQTVLACIEKADELAWSPPSKDELSDQVITRLAIPTSGRPIAAHQMNEIWAMELGLDQRHFAGEIARAMGMWPVLGAVRPTGGTRIEQQFAASFRPDEHLRLDTAWLWCSTGDPEGTVVINPDGIVGCHSKNEVRFVVPETIELPRRPLAAELLGGSSIVLLELGDGRVVPLPFVGGNHGYGWGYEGTGPRMLRAALWHIATMDTPGTFSDRVAAWRREPEVELPEPKPIGGGWRWEF